MKKLFKYSILHLPLLMMILLIQCNEKKSYSITIEGNNLYITMPYPRVGVSGINQKGWSDFKLEDIIEETFIMLRKNAKSGIVNVWIKLEDPQKDKYGNQTMKYDNRIIAKVPISEVKKFKDYKYFDKEYHISRNIESFIQSNIKTVTFPKILLN